MIKALLCLTSFASSQAKLPSTYYASSVKGKFKKSFNANSYGCSVAWYTDKGKWGYPYCPGDTIEVHSDFAKLNAQSRDNSGWTNHVSCMNCHSFGGSTQDFLGKTFQMVCSADGVISSLKELFSDLMYGSNTFSLEEDGTFGFPGEDGQEETPMYQHWSAGDDGKMVWTTYHDTVCSGICDLRYTLVDKADGFGNASAGAVWFKITNYYEIGEAVCDIELVSASSSRRLSGKPVVV
jgi:hypothetical protein